MPITLDGSLADWTPQDRLETEATAVAGYEIYGRFEADAFLIALKAPEAIGANTTFWLNTDGNVATGHQIWGWAAGAEFNINVGIDGIPRLYTGADGEIEVGAVDYALSGDGTVMEIRIAKAVLGADVTAIAMHADVNNAVFLPNNFGLAGYQISQPEPAPTGPIDGDLAEWTTSQRLETPATTVAGYELFGKVEGGNYMLALKSAEPIGAGTTFWLNTDNNTATGHLIWDWAGGAEFNVNIGSDGVARLYSGADGQTLVADIAFALSADKKSIELSIPKTLIGSTDSITIMADVNNAVFLPADYTQPGYKLTDPASQPSASNDGHKIAIVFSESTAANFFSAMAYSQLVMAAQSQAMAAGVPFDVIGEADLTDLAKLAQYDAIVFPSFRNVPANYGDIANVLHQLVFDYDIPLVVAGDFMTNDAAGNSLPGNAYERMHTLLGLTRTGGDSQTEIKIVAADGGHSIVSGYGAGATINTYSGPAASTSYFDTVGGLSATVIAQQIVGGVAHNGVVATTTGAQNVHFATEALFADSNLLGKALDYVLGSSEGVSVSLHMSRFQAIVASRNDMDQSQETYDVDGGIYDALLPIVTLGALLFGELLAGAVLTEQIFTIPGFGKMIVDAVFNRDYAVVQGVVLVTATSFIVINLMADVLYFVLNPRMRASL